VSTADNRLDELVSELDQDARDSTGPSAGFVDDIVSTARWQRTVRGGLGTALKLLEAFGDALKQALGAPRK